MLAPAITACLCLAASAYAAIGPVADLHVVNGPVAPDGFRRMAVLAGATPETATAPGPVIVGKKGDNFRLNVINSLTNETMLKSTTIHWHGIFQHKTAWADGVEGVTQCPIAPNESFLYDFTVPDQAGTFWYHSHYETQYCDGLRGALVIYDPEDPHKHLYDVDDESTIITLADWYHAAASLSHLAPTPDSALINGLGRSYDNGIATELAIVNVVKGKRYRFRLVSLSCDPNYIFSIDGHNMTVIEVDGISHQPHLVDSIQIFVAQRYSFVLEANQPVDNYWIRADPNIGTSGFKGGINSAVLRYRGAPNVYPDAQFKPRHMPLLEKGLHPLENPGAPGGSGPPDIAINLSADFDVDELLFHINGMPGFLPPSVPVLLQILSGARTAQELLPVGTVYALPPNKVIEVSVPGGSAGSPHAFHLHGHAFDVIRTVGSTEYNYVNPVRRDVVSTGGPGDNVTFRFLTDNSGPWILHCHIEWHLTNALAVVFAEDTNGTSLQSQPVAWDKLCPTYNALPTGDK